MRVAGQAERCACCGAAPLIAHASPARWPRADTRSGVLVRAAVAEAREARYRAAGRDCYLFNLDDAQVLDATEAGALTRFTVRPAPGSRAG